MSHTPHRNLLRAKFAEDEVALGVLDNAYSPSLIELYGELGMDFVWLDFEHGGPSPWNAERLEDFLRAADATDTEILARLPTSDPALVRKALDAGVRNLFLPRVETAVEVREAVQAARFEYDDEPGNRGLANPRARRWGLKSDYVAAEDRETLVGVTIETPLAVENIDEILDVPELGFVFLGPLDMSVGTGHPGDLDHPDVEAAIETAREAALDADVPVGGLGFNPDDIQQKIDQGYQLLNTGSTTGAVRSATSKTFEALDIDRS